MTTESEDGDARMAPEEAFGLLGNETRIGILQALWDAFESGRGGNDLSYTELFEAVDYDDSGNFSYHLEKLTGPFVRQTADGYELKQTGINVVRAVVTGTVIGDPEFGPTSVDLACPRCGGGVEVAYADELVTVACTDCGGAIRWNDDAGYLFLGLVPPTLVDERSIDGAARAAIAFTLYQLAALYHAVCPHCSGIPDRSLDVCPDHDPGAAGLCSTCDRYHRAAADMVCQSCKWRVFPPAAVVLSTHPRVTAFYRTRGIDHHFATWEGLARTFDVDEEIVSEAPPRMRLSFPADDAVLGLTLDEDVDVVDVHP